MYEGVRAVTIRVLPRLVDPHYLCSSKASALPNTAIKNLFEFYKKLRGENRDILMIKYDRQNRQLLCKTTNKIWLITFSISLLPFILKFTSSSKDITQQSQKEMEE